MSKLTEKPKSQSELTSVFWPEIVLRRNEFTLKQKKIDALSKLDLETLRAFSENYLINENTRKKLRYLLPFVFRLTQLSVRVQAPGKVPGFTATEIKTAIGFKENSMLHSTGETIPQVRATDFKLSPQFCPMPEPKNDTTPPTPPEPQPGPQPQPQPQPKEEDTCIADWCLTNNQFCMSFSVGEGRRVKGVGRR